MIVEAQVSMQGSRDKLWAAIADIENAASFTRGIERIEMIDRPAGGLVGTRWRETRILFGEPATVEKWITAASENTSYETRAESDGFVFVTTRRIVQEGGKLVLAEAHESRPQGLMASVKMIPMRLFFKGVIRKALLQDLNDIRAVVEA
jgi:hypothetical protein